MNIMMFTNTFTPHVGGVARSVQGLAEGLRDQGHRVLVVAPVFEGMPESERDVVRIPALQHFRGSDFSVPIPVGHRLDAVLRTFAPDIIHSHHPFLLGDTALRVAATCDVPVVFTYHTRYEYYSHYAPVDSPRLKRLALNMALGYCELCDAVIAPSESLTEFLRQYGVEGLIEVIPTGVHLEQLASGDGGAARGMLDIPEDAFLLGHVGRLAPEKNLAFLAEAIVRFLLGNERAHCLIAGEGAMKQVIRDMFEKHGLGARLHLAGVLDAKGLADAYCAMDVFAFSSLSETQGLVLAEAMAAGVPVVALDAPGAREIVRDGVNGRLLAREDLDVFIAALAWIAALDPEEVQGVRQAARETATGFSLPSSIQRVLTLYRSLIAAQPSNKDIDESAWSAARRSLSGEWRILRIIAQAVGDAVLLPSNNEKSPETSKVCGAKRDTAPEVDGANCEGASTTRSPEIRVRILGLLGAWFLRLQRATWRVEIEGLERMDEMHGAGERVLVAFWHGRYFPLFTLLRGRKALVFTTDSFRGRVISEIGRRFGYTCILLPRHKGVRLLDFMRTTLASQYTAALAVDGPLGPYHVVKSGAIELASTLGFALVPTTAASRRKHVMARRWDRMEVPGLFSRVALVIGEPLKIPSDLSRKDIPIWQGRLREALEAAEKRAGEMPSRG